MAIIKNITEEEISGRLNKSEDPYLEAQEESILFMERASFGDYINKTDHELENLREEIMTMSQYELRTFKKTERAPIKAGDVEQCLKVVYGVATSGRF
jgi:hypothetical protein